MEKRICIGKIVAAHGIRGEVKVASYTKNPFDLDKFGVVENQDASKTFSLKVTGKTSANIRVKIKGVDDRNTAEELIGTEFYINRDKLPELGEEEYYHADIIGLDVCLTSPANIVGKVVGFYNFGAGDIIELKFNNQKETEMLPFTKEYVPVINIAEGYVVISSAQMHFAEEQED
ncbi:MAG: 16S rRNA processing protein RimM [Alphaproteobacteria bacterium]|nr:16S rRNA processing protein RimM [Alphaproteobacteria bacterium]